MGSSWVSSGRSFPLSSRDLKETMREMLRRRGLEIGRYRNTYRHRRQQILQSEEVDLVVDVGANDGAWVLELRRGGYGGHVISLEPDARPYERLCERARNDGLWTTHQVGAGTAAGRLAMHLSSSALWNSFRPVTPSTVRAEPTARTVSTAEVEVVRLDEVVPTGRRVMIKVDVQGFEREVLDGAPRLLGEARVVEMELCPSMLYEGQDLMVDIVMRLEEAGLGLVLVDNVAVRPDGRAMAINGLFCRS